MADKSNQSAEQTSAATKSVTDMSVLEIENYLIERRFTEGDAKRKLEQEAEKQFIANTKVEIYEASDYCGLRAGPYSFYYGYEVMDDNDEWCFTTDWHSIRELTLPTSKLWPKDEGLLWYLLSGIGQYMQSRGNDLLTERPDTNKKQAEASS